MAENLAPTTYWSESYKQYGLAEAAMDDPVKLWLHEYLPNGSGDSFEIGCYPGRYQPTIGAKGYRLNGIDLYPDVQDRLAVWLAHSGYRVGTFYREDFTKYHTTERKYEVVCSFGFLEHFTNYREIIDKHLQFVKPGGYLVLAAPNFRGAIQHKLHAYLDRQNLQRHNLHAMDPLEWANIVARQGYNILFAGYFGLFDFWVDADKQSFCKRKIIKLIDLFKPLLRQLLPEGGAVYSPFCGLVAKKAHDLGG